ncbi:hypothetical protein RchiOBHm_Chr5g0025191 [Rosa chinensis]|uniref:Non-specific serine/threonine protein kinase n=1 Tax=Rosa chinensis TaxID=74649 RepID=A0A2P6Q8J3_ROSCH|nr:hypothetical protein RchiOBHm_Chr5g0025191 [Rosa chinensis]
MKLGVNHSNGLIWSLTSWTTNYYPPLGIFTLDWDPNGRQLEIRGRWVVYWRSGNFTASGNKFEFILPDERLLFNFSIVSNKNEDCLTYTSEKDDQNGEYLPEWVMSFYGRLYNYNGGVDIARADNCGGYNTDGGCQRSSWPPDCLADFDDQYELKKGYFKPITSIFTS